MAKQRVDPRLEQAFALFLVAAVATGAGFLIVKAANADKFDMSADQVEQRIKQTDVQ